MALSFFHIIRVLGGYIGNRSQLFSRELVVEVVGELFVGDDPFLLHLAMMADLLGNVKVLLGKI